jgi:hypothetical protein
MTLSPAYQEIIDFIAAATRPENIIAFRPSDSAKERVADLIERGKSDTLTQEERSELEHYLQLEPVNFWSMIKTYFSSDSHLC